MPHTIRDIARMAGVCIGTVSRVLNNKDKVHPETRKKILDLIERTGYRPSVLGRNLALRRTHNILVEMFNIADPYCAGVVKKIAAHCRRRGYATLTGDCDYDPEIEAEYLRQARGGHVDGLIVSPLPAPPNAACFEELVRAHFPLVLMDSEAPGIQANCVCYDDAAGARLAMDYLFGAGHRRIAFCGWQMAFQTVRDRLAGYVAAHAGRAPAPPPELILKAPRELKDWDAASALASLLRLAPPPTAILAENDIMALTCIHALARLGRRVPDDVAVVSFGAPAAEAFLPMPLTHVCLHEEQAVERAVELLFELIDNPKLRRRPARKIVIAPELVLGQSA